eukprot:517430-Pelagomonas_calceolata.AAC.1
MDPQSMRRALNATEAWIHKSLNGSTNGSTNYASCFECHGSMDPQMQGNGLDGRTRQQGVEQGQEKAMRHGTSFELGNFERWVPELSAHIVGQETWSRSVMYFALKLSTMYVEVGE